MLYGAEAVLCTPALIPAACQLLHSELIYNLAGLYLVKHGSSILNAISGAIILPLTVLEFHSSYIGSLPRAFDWLTIAGLCVVLTG